MSGTHGVFQHRTGYFYTILEEDFCEMYKAEGVNEVCRAYITSILENLTNKQFDGTGNNEEIWVFISLPEMARRMRNACSERTIHKEIQGMIKDGYLKKRRASNKATMEYCLSLKKIRDGLASLPDKQSCNSARTDLANLQDQSGKFARSTLQICKNDLANLQPRIKERNNKEERMNDTTPAVTETEAKSPLQSLDHSSLSSSSQGKPSSETDRVKGYWKQLGYRDEKSSAWSELSQETKTFEEFKSLFEFTEKQLQKDPRLSNKGVHPGNMLNSLNEWKQAEKRKQTKDVPVEQKITAGNRHMVRFR